MPRFVLNNGKQYDISEQDIQEFAQSVEVDGLEIVGVISPENIEKLNEEAPPTEIEMISEEEKPKIELEETAALQNLEDIGTPGPAISEVGVGDPIKAPQEKAAAENQKRIEREAAENEPKYLQATYVNKEESDNELKKELIERFKKAETPVAIGGYNTSVTYIPKNDFTEGELSMYNSWKDTGDFELDEKISAEKISKKKDILSRKFLENVDDDVRRQVLNNVRKTSVELDKDYNTVNTQLQANFNTLKILKRNADESAKFGINPSKEDISKAKTLIKEAQKQANELINIASEKKDVDLMIDAYKRNYGNIEQLGGVWAELLTSTALGLSDAADMLAKDRSYESELTKYLFEVDKSIQEYNKEYLPKAVSIEDVFDGASLGTWMMDSFIKQTPYLAALTTPYAVPFYIKTGITGKLAEFKREEKEAEERIKEAYKALEDKNLNDLDREKIKTFIKEQNLIIDKNDAVKLLSAGIYGAAEGIDAVTDKLLLNGTFSKGLNVLGVDDIGKAIFKSVKSIPAGAALEVAQENTTGVIQNLVDIANGKDVSMFENAKETTAQAIFFGSGFRVVNTASVAQGALLNEIADRTSRNKVNKKLKEINDIKILIEKKQKKGLVVDPKYKEDLKKLEQEIVDEIDISATKLLELPFEQQKEVFELARKARKVKKSYQEAMLDPNLSEEEKDLIKEKRAEEYEELQNKKRALLDTDTGRVVNVLVGKLDTNEQYNEEQLRRISKFRVQTTKNKIHNKKAKNYDKDFEVYNQDIKNIEKFLNETTDKTLKLINGQEINRKEADLILRQSEVQFVKGQPTVSNALFNKENNSITYFVDRIARSSKENIALHEYTHAMLNKLGLSKEEFENIKDGLVKEFTKTKKLNTKQKQTLKALKDLTYSDYDPASLGEELLVGIGDLISKDVINKSKNADFLEVLGFKLKNVIQRIAGKDVANGVKLNSIDGAIDFLTNFQKSVQFNSRQSIRNIAAQEDSEIDDAASRSNLQDLLSAEENKAAFIAKTLQDSKGEFPISMLDSKFGQELAPVLETLAKKRFDPIPEDATRIVDENRSNARKQWKEELLNEIIADVSNNYKPGEQNLDKYVTIRAFQRSNRTAKRLGIESIVEKGGGGIATDITEAFDVASEQTDTAGESIIDLLNLPQEFKTKILDLEEKAILKAEKALTGKNLTDVKKLKERNKAFAEIFVDRLFNDISTELGKNTKTSDAFSQYLNKNFEPLLNAALTYIDFQMGSGVSSNWSLDNPPSKEAFIDYYEGKDIAPGKPASLKSDRKKKLNNAIARAISNESRVKLDPTEIGQKFKNTVGIGLASRELVDELFLETGKNFIKKLEKELGLEPGTVKLQNFQTFEEFKEHIELQKKYIWSRVPKEFIQFSLSDTANMYANKNFRQVNKKAREGGNKKLKEYVLKEIADFKNWGSPMLDQNGEVITNFKNQPYKNSIQKLGDKITKGYTEENHNLEAEQALREFNNRNNRIGRQMFNRFNEAVIDDPNAAVAIAQFFQLATNNAEHPIRYLAEVVGFSLNPKGARSNPTKENPDGTFKLLEYEHAMQQVHVGRTLILSMLSPDRNFHIDLEAVLNNFKLIALDQADNLKLKSAGYMHDMPVGWEVFSSSWLERYFNDMVAMHGGIDPNGIIHITGKTFAEVYNVNTNGFNIPDIGLASRETLSEEFNKILEDQSGVKAEAIYSEDRARKLAGKAGKFQFFIPYSAEDFIGLTYPTLAKGKKGEEAQQWYKDNIIQPYARGYRDYEADKTNTLNKWEALKKQIKNTPSNLKKDAVRGFSNEEAIRVYLWNKQDVAPETLAKKDISALTKYVEGNKQLLDFAQQIQSLLGVDGYPNPTSDWLSGTLTTDLVGYVNTVSRAKHLKEWSDNVDIVYSKDNLNKLRALYGDKYVEALVNSISRMKSGRNRISGNRLESAWLNYIGSGAVGTIMFFNSRSALLQTISSLNYVNFTFNNPLAVAKAFANQPQFWKDFSFLFNSDYMQSRRKGLKTDIDADEIANAAAMSKNKVRAALSYILKKGYLPTQYADNFAIAFGGASFYRNRINSYIRQGLSEKEAQEKAFLEFQETSEESQQSARPDKISMEQASSLGRLILAFANTPMQYARIIKKSSLDLVNGRGDWKENMGKIIWYSSMQNLIFTSLQQALFALAFDDDDDTPEKDKEKYIRTLNGMADTILRGTGVGGAVISVIKNGILKYIEEQNSKRPDYTKVGLEAINLSPPISSRIKKMINIGRVFTYKQTRKDMRELGYDIDNPYYQVAGQTLSATFNLPADRLVQKMRNIKDALDDQNETWQRIALALGWPDWQLGIDNKSKGVKGISMEDYLKELKNTNPRLYNFMLRNEQRRKNKSPNKKLKKGVAGVAHKDGTIEIAPDLSPKERKLTLLHEQQHQIDMKSGKLNYDKKFVYYNNNKYARKNGKIMYNGKAYKEGDPDLPWEKRAYKAEKTKKFLYA